jgi:phosphoserine aminotransferase
LIINPIYKYINNKLEFDRFNDYLNMNDESCKKFIHNQPSEQDIHHKLIFDHSDHCPKMSSGPCVKPIHHRTESDFYKFSGRSLFSSDGRKLTYELEVVLRRTLHIPDDHQIFFTPGSASGAVETALWNFAGAHPMTCLGWDVFGRRWGQECKKFMSSVKVDHFESQNIPQFKKEHALNFTQWFKMVKDASHDILPSDYLWTWCGTPSGLWAGWSQEHFSTRKEPYNKGLIFCDLTSAAFAVDIPWQAIDFGMFSFQKVLGGEAGLGVLVLHPRITPNHVQKRAIPGTYTLLENHDWNQRKWKSTPSLFTIQDALHNLNDYEMQGGLKFAQNTCRTHLKCAEEAVMIWSNMTCPHLAFRVEDPAYRAPTAVTFVFVDKNQCALPALEASLYVKKYSEWLQQQHIAYDVMGHPGEYPSIRFWFGPFVRLEDIQRILNVLTDAFCKRDFILNDGFNV